MINSLIDYAKFRTHRLHISLQSLSIVIRLGGSNALEECEPLTRSGRPKGRTQRGGGEAMARLLYEIRPRICRLRGKVPATPGESIRTSQGVTYVSRTICYPCVRYGQSSLATKTRAPRSKASLIASSDFSSACVLDGTSSSNRQCRDRNEEWTRSIPLVSEILYVPVCFFLAFKALRLPHRLEELLWCNRRRRFSFRARFTQGLRQFARGKGPLGF